MASTGIGIPKIAATLPLAFLERPYKYLQKGNNI
jgi:hypothetical protein